MQPLSEIVNEDMLLVYILDEMVFVFAEFCSWG
jgi:hypothetical protein